MLVRAIALFVENTHCVDSTLYTEIDSYFPLRIKIKKQIISLFVS